MTKTRIIAASVLTVLLAGCSGSDGSGSPQAGGCEQGQRNDGSNAQGGGHSTAAALVATRAAVHEILDRGAVTVDQHAVQAVQLDTWQPPNEPYAVGESFTVEDWTVRVTEIDYDATEEVEAALASRGLSYAGTRIDGWTWVVADVVLTYDGTGTASTEAADLESRFVAADGQSYIDFQCGIDNLHVEMTQGETSALSFGVPVPPSQIDGGLWGIGPGDDPSIDELTFVAPF